MSWVEWGRGWKHVVIGVRRERRESRRCIYIGERLLAYRWELYRVGCRGVLDEWWEAMPAVARGWEAGASVCQSFIDGTA